MFYQQTDDVRNWRQRAETKTCIEQYTENALYQRRKALLMRIVTGIRTSPGGFVSYIRFSEMALDKHGEFLMKLKAINVRQEEIPQASVERGGVL